MSKISVVTPTLRRPAEIAGLLANLAQQRPLPMEVIVIDGAPLGQDETMEATAAASRSLPYSCRYIRCGGGTAVQRNAGIDAAGGEFIAFIDDDIHLEPGFFSEIVALFDHDTQRRVGGVAGYITNQHLDPVASPRWRWYRRLRLFTTYEPGRYDYRSGYPINRYLQPPHEGVKPIDFMGAGCAVWRREVFAGGLRFSPFFTGYGLLEDAHLALRAAREWVLLECGRARCAHLKVAGNRPPAREVARKSAVNYRYVFIDLVPKRTLGQEFRFWRVQAVDLLRFAARACRTMARDDRMAALGKAEGIVAALRLDRSCAGRSGGDR